MRKLFAGIAAVLMSSILWGCLASVGFFVLIDRHVLPYSDLFIRYTTREWVQQVETVFFFVGIAELLLKSFDIAEQRGRLNKVSLLGEQPDGAGAGGRQPIRCSSNWPQCRRVSGKAIIRGACTRRWRSARAKSRPPRSKTS